VPLQPDPELLQQDEIIRLASIFTTHGVDKIRLTGGEPLLQKDLVDIVGGLRQYCSHIGMTTNGVKLSRHLDRLVDTGLSHINISLDTLNEATFLDMTRQPGLQPGSRGFRGSWCPFQAFNDVWVYHHPFKIIHDNTKRMEDTLSNLNHSCINNKCHV
jgi:molybdenum cofactor biosynthesis enzyme MoaA